jgi:hypothetical protein
MRTAHLRFLLSLAVTRLLFIRIHLDPVAA